MAIFPFNNAGFPFGFPLPWESRANRYTLPSVNVSVGTKNVTIELPNHSFLNKSFVGSFFLHLRNAIPTGTQQTLPVLIGVNGDTRPLMATEGTQVTAGELSGAGIYEIHYNRYTNELYLVNAGYRPTTAATATANATQTATANQEAAAANFDDFRK